jgi:hypothetical protein
MAGARQHAKRYTLIAAYLCLHNCQRIDVYFGHYLRTRYLLGSGHGQTN